MAVSFKLCEIWESCIIKKHQEYNREYWTLLNKREEMKKRYLQEDGTSDDYQELLSLAEAIKACKRNIILFEKEIALTKKNMKKLKDAV